MYNSQFMVKYKGIEEELILKFCKDLDSPLEYSKQDVYDICEGLYQHELLSVFNVTNIDDITISTTILNVWLKIKENNDFMEVFEMYKQKNGCLSDDILFTTLFNYDSFFIIHECICEALENGNIIKKDKIEKLKNNIL